MRISHLLELLLWRKHKYTERKTIIIVQQLLKKLLPEVNMTGWLSLLKLSTHSKGKADWTRFTSWFTLSFTQSALYRLAFSQATPLKMTFIDFVVCHDQDLNVTKKDNVFNDFNWPAKSPI